ncbi:MAG TPA: hypothetical protein V6D08_02750 [Candidatus Obscuribacterales bacterium]
MTNQCGAYTFNDERETFMQAALGSRFTIEPEQTVVLERGRIVAGTRRRELRVKAGLITTVVKPESAAVIEAEPDKPPRITVLNSEGPDGVVVQVGKSKFTVKQSGDELVVAEQGVPEEQIKPKDGIRRQFEPALLGSGNVRIFVAHVPIEDAIRKNIVFNCTYHFLENYLPVRKVTGREGLADKGPSRLGQVNPQPAPASIVKPVPSEVLPRMAPPAVTARQPAVPPATPLFLKPVAHRVSRPPSWMRASSDSALVESDPKHYHLSQGSTLAEVRDGLRMETRHGTVFAKPGSVVLVSADDKITRVLNLADKHGGSVDFVVGKHVVPLAPGTELNILPRSARDAEALVWSDGIARRDLRITPVDSNLQLIINQVSIVDAFAKNPLLAGLRASGSPADKSLARRIVRTAAVIALTSDRFKGPYAVPIRRAEAVSLAPRPEKEGRRRTY